MPYVLSDTEINVLLGDEDKNAHLYQDEIVLHKEVYELFAQSEEEFSPVYTYSIEAYPKAKLTQLLRRIKNQCVLSILNDTMTPYAKNKYEKLLMKRDDVYIENVFDHEDVPQPRSVASLYNNLGKDSRFVNSYIYMLSLSKKHYEDKSELSEELRAIERDVITPMREECDEGYPLESIIDKITNRYYRLQNALEQKEKINHYTQMSNTTHLEFYTKKELIRKLVFLSYEIRREGILTTQENYMDGEPCPLFVKFYDLMFDSHFEELFMQEQSRYMDAMREKLEYVAKEYLFDLWVETSLKVQTPFSESELLYLESLEEYTISQLRMKRECYMARALEHGMLYIEKYQEHEKNTLIYNLIDMHVSGFESDSIREYASREIKYRLMHYETLWEMLFVGFRGLRDGENPRSLGTYLLSFIEEGERESVLEAL
ncbi:MAG: hypothetical protein PHQ22_09030 [Sulfuricurvum sp.]|nr:hypothetical protein [Sulfuricurvum sp.]